MNKRISLNGSDWLLKEFYGEKDPPRMLVLRLGSFGKPDFFKRALEHLKS